MKYHRYAYCHRFGLAAAKALLILLALGAAGSAVAQSSPHIGYCGWCSADSAFSNAAVQTAPDWAPGNGTPVNYPVYVVNPNSREVRYFNVFVWYDWGDGSPHSTDPGDSMESAGSGNSVQSFGLQKEAYPASGDSQLIVVMKDALQLVQQFASQINNASVTTGDLGSDLDSVIQLVGPEDSSAGYQRNALLNQIDNYYNNVWTYISWGVSDILRGWMKRFAGESGLIQHGGTMTISAPDGTQIKIRLRKILDSIDGEGIHLDLEVLQHTAQGPGLPAVPQSPGQFDGFSHNGDFVDEIVDLAWRHGIPVTGSGGGGIVCTRVDGGGWHCELLHF